MSAIQQKYKEKIIGYGNTKESRFIRAKEREESRKRQRAENFNNCRNISISSRTENKKMQSNHVVKDDFTRFLKWKAKQERRRMEQMKKKQPFVVGIVHHKIYSPILSYRTTNSNITNNKVCNKTVPVSSAPLQKRITKATEKKSMNNGLTKEAINQSSKSKKYLNNGQKNRKKQELSFAPTNYKSECRTKLSRIPLFVGIATKRISHTKINKSALSPTKISETSKINNTTECTVENINYRNNNIAVIDEQKDADDLNGSSIEPVSVKLLFDEERFTSYNEINNNNKDDSELKIQDNDVCNSSTTKALCFSKNDMFILTPSDPQDEEIFYSPYVILSYKNTSARKEQGCGVSLSHSKDEFKKCSPVENICKQPNNSTKIESPIKSTIEVTVGQNIITNEVVINAKRKLSFNPEKFDDVNLQYSELRNSTNRKESEVPSIKIHTATPLKHSNLNKSTNVLFSKTCLTEQCTDSNILKQEPLKCIYINNKEEPSEYNENMKALRNKSTIVVDALTRRKSARKVNVQGLKQKENKTPSMKGRKKSFAKVALNANNVKKSKPYIMERKQV